jgi:hypothetical protein
MCCSGSRRATLLSIFSGMEAIGATSVLILHLADVFARRCSFVIILFALHHNMLALSGPRTADVCLLQKLNERE